MKLDKAIQQLNDEMIRKFVLDTKNNVLHIFENPFPEVKDTHKKLAVDRGVDLVAARGGRLKVEKDKFNFESGSSTIYTASKADLDNFHGEVEIF